MIASEPNLTAKPGMRLFYQIALRLAAVAALFALLEIVIVLAMYMRNEDALSEDLISLESERIAHLIHERGANLLPAQIFPGSTTRAAAVFDSQGTMVFSVNPGHLPLPDTSLKDLHSATSREVRGETFFLSGIRRIEVDGRTFWVALAIPGRGFRPFVPALYQEVLDHVLLPLIPLSVLLLIFNVVIVRRMLTPLERAVTDVDALDPGDLSRRLQLPTSPIEVRSLLRAVNRALERVERAMATLRRFTADAAHELRTPLAVMTLTIDRLPQSVEREALRQDTAAMARLITQMLDLSRVDALANIQGRQSDLNELASRVATEITPLAISAGKRVSYRDDGNSIVSGQPELIERAIRNLIENALAHTPTNSEVEVVVGPNPQISVRDHGPGIPPDKHEKVFERFWRGGNQQSGAGLGLAITRSIMEACGGRVDIENSSDGGAIVKLVFRE